MLELPCRKAQFVLTLTSNIKKNSETSTKLGNHAMQPVAKYAKPSTPAIYSAHILTFVRPNLAQIVTPKRDMDNKSKM